MNSLHAKYMVLALALAKKGLGSVSPNPMVGCVIVKNNEIVAEGYHQKYGEAHAEVNAINNLPKDIDPSECILYVTLEPCSHFGKTPPCSDLIIKKGFKKVVICNLDPNPLVAGKGIEKLKNAGIEVNIGICEREGRFLNRRFFTFHEKKRPYIILKWAQTADGFISKWPLPKDKKDNWISEAEAQKIAHQMRSEEDAILVGRNTILNDDPKLTTRLVLGKNPVRIIISKEMEFDQKFSVFNSEAKTLVFNGEESKVKENIRWIKIDFEINVIQQILNYLVENNISSLIVEGGTQTLNSFINAGLWDEIHVFVNPNLSFNKGIEAPIISLPIDFQELVGDRYYTLFSNFSPK
jgi:diaminohydroxyphosphoribosylaminopyrimidine deaminase/5-amino-6-(5-phosphoribosylamino)uracil reductase